jgi:hypothetical protein
MYYGPDAIYKLRHLVNYQQIYINYDLDSYIDSNELLGKADIYLNITDDYSRRLKCQFVKSNTSQQELISLVNEITNLNDELIIACKSVMFDSITLEEILNE